MLVGLLWNQWSFLILFSIIHFGCWWEYFNLLEKIHNTTYHPYTRFGFMLMGYAIMLWFCGPEFHLGRYDINENFSFPVSVAGFVMVALGIFQTQKINLRAFSFAALGLIYISLAWGFMIDIRHSLVFFTRDISVRGPIIIIATIWINDTMAYIVGSAIGKHPLSKVSPKKTWEGTVGGILFATILVGIIVLRTFEETYWLPVFTFPLIVSIAGTIGDLLESKLKRMAGVKDSGSIMPGHGGFLDRYDSLLVATPAIWIYVLLFL